MKKIILNNGLEIPLIGYGTYKLPEEKVQQCVSEAIDVGYRLIDTASAYNTEIGIGYAIKDFERDGHSRKELIISSKVANEDQGYKPTLNAFERTINKLETDYLDIYLIHWPIPKDKQNSYKILNIETWSAMEELYVKGYIKAMGVCNFLPRHIDNIIENSTIKPTVNQLEIHPFYQQMETVKYCHEHGIAVEAWSPLNEGKIFDNPILKELSLKYSITVSQLCLKWCVQRNIIPIPKTATKTRMLDNYNSTNINVQIDEYDMALIAKMQNENGYANFWNYKRQLKY